MDWLGREVFWGVGSGSGRPKGERVNFGGTSVERRKRSDGERLGTGRLISAGGR